MPLRQCVGRDSGRGSGAGLARVRAATQSGRLTPRSLDGGPGQKRAGRGSGPLPRHAIRRHGNAETVESPLPGRHWRLVTYFFHRQPMAAQGIDRRGPKAGAGAQFTAASFRQFRSRIAVCFCFVFANDARRFVVIVVTKFRRAFREKTLDARRHFRRVWPRAKPVSRAPFLGTAIRHRASRRRQQKKNTAS